MLLKKEQLLRKEALFYLNLKAFLLTFPKPCQKGPIAQLGERLHGMQEVSGSIPLGSTIS